MNKQHEIDFLSKDIEDVILVSKSRTLTDDESTLLYKAFRAIAISVWKLHTVPKINGIQPFERENFIHDTATHLMMYVLPRFESEKYFGRKINYFVVAARHYLTTHTWRYKKAMDKQIAVVTNDGEQENALEVPLDIAVTYDNETTSSHSRLERCEHLWNEMCSYYKDKPYKNERYNKVLDTTNRIIEKKLVGEKVVLNKDDYRNGIYTTIANELGIRTELVGNILKILSAKYLRHKYYIQTKGSIGTAGIRSELKRLINVDSKIMAGTDIDSALSSSYDDKPPVVKVSYIKCDICGNYNRNIQCGKCHAKNKREYYEKYLGVS